MNTPTSELRTALYVLGPASATLLPRIPGLLASGFNTLILAFIDIDERGNLIQGGEILCSGGRYVGPPKLPQTLRSLLKHENGGQGSVTKLGFSIGGAERDDYRFLWRSFVQPSKVINGVHDMFPTNNMLVANMIALRETFPCIDFIDMNCEEYLDDKDPTYQWTETVVSLGYLASNLGFEVSLCASVIFSGPLRSDEGWIQCYLRLKALHADVDAIYVQNYYGWKSDVQRFAYALYVATLDPTVFRRIIPGLTATGASEGRSPAEVQSTLATYNNPYEIPAGSHLTLPPLQFGGAFIWNDDCILTSYMSDPQQALKDYCAAIINGLKLPN